MVLHDIVLGVLCNALADIKTKEKNHLVLSDASSAKKEP